MVVTKQSALPLAALHGAFTIGAEVRLDDLVFPPLVVALVVVVLDVIVDNEAQRSVARLLAKDPVSLSQIVDLVLLTAIEPTGHGQNDELQCMGCPPRLPR